MESGGLQMHSHAVRNISTEWICFGLDVRKWQKFLIKLISHRLNWLQYPTYMIVSFCQICQWPSQHDIYISSWVIITRLREFWILERKPEGKKRKRNVKCYWFLTQCPLSVASLLNWPGFFGLLCTQIKTNFSAFFAAGWPCDSSELMRCKRELLSTSVQVDNVLDLGLVFIYWGKIYRT